MSNLKNQKPSRVTSLTLDSPRNSPRNTNVAKADKGKESKQAEQPENEAKRSTQGQRENEGEYIAFQEELRAMLMSMEERMSKRFEQIDSKFTRIFNGLKAEISSLRTDVTETKSHIDIIETKVKDMEESIEFNAATVKEVEKGQDGKLAAFQQKLEEKIKELDNKLLLLEKHDRKYNLLFYGVSEEQNENVIDIVRELFKNDLEIEEDRVNGMYFISGHRIPSESQGPKPIILRFSSSEDKDLVMSQSYKLAGSKRRILVDLPLPMKKERARLAREAYKIRQHEHLQTRIREKGLDVFLQVRKDEHGHWVKRDA